MARPEMGDGLRTALAMGFLLMATLAAPQLDAAETAAVVHFVSGTVSLRKADGGESALRRADELREGDTVLSADDGRVHLQFSDGGFVSLIPGSEFRIEAYRRIEKSNGDERLFMRLMKGGLRTVSGRIGKGNRAAYQMITGVATIGIRGTEYTLRYLPAGGLTGSVAEGRIESCNAGGCLDVDAGQSFLAPDGNTRPVLTAKAAELGAPPPARRARHDGSNAGAKDKQEGVKKASRNGKHRGKEKLIVLSQTQRLAAADTAADEPETVRQAKTGHETQIKGKHGENAAVPAKGRAVHDSAIARGYDNRASMAADKLAAKRAGNIIGFGGLDTLPSTVDDSIRERVSLVLETGSGGVKGRDAGGKQKPDRK